MSIMNNKGNGIIGRKNEQDTLRYIMEEKEAKMVAVYGRRRVGKTFLVRRFFNDQFDFYFTGSFETPASIQLALFASQLRQYSGEDVPVPKSWFDAFELLRDYLEKIDKPRIVVFFDELPWMDTPKSNFIQAFSYFWNSWASARWGMKMIICGSATSWMIDKIIGDTGGLYGRCSRTIYLAPFCLGEVEHFLKEAKGIVWNRYQILEAYMIMGGIPYYLDMLDRNKTFSQNIDSLFFAHGAPLMTEYDFLFRSLFKSSAIYRQVVETIASKSRGLTLKEIKESLGNIGDGGGLSIVLDNLCKCDFIRRYYAFGKKERGAVYQLTDMFTLFHTKFIRRDEGLDQHFWSNIKDAQHNAWAGYAFEQVCLHHLSQIRRALGISGVLTSVSAWSCKRQTDRDGTEWDGAQIDLVLERADKVIDLCEMKYSQSEFAVTADYDRHLRERISTFRHFTKTRHALHNVLVTTYGLRYGMYSGIFQSTVTMDALFEEIICPY